MTVTLQEFNKNRARTDLPEIKAGDIVKVHQKIVEIRDVGKKKETKERIQIFEGLVMGRRGKKGINSTITVRKISSGIGVERIFPVNAPTVEKIELIKETKTRRAKLNYMRKRIGKAAQLKGKLVKKDKSVAAADTKNATKTQEISAQKENIEAKTKETKHADSTKIEEKNQEKKPELK